MPRAGCSPWSGRSPANGSARSVKRATTPLIDARQLYLWPVETYRDSGTSVFFGIGVGSGGYSGAGMGIGF
jgi:hypothetical protein